MRYLILVFSLFFGISALAQPILAQKRVQFDYQFSRVDDLVTAHLQRSDKDSGELPSTPYLTGRVTDFSGRSVRGAEIMLFSLDTDEVKHTRTNSFGFYRIKDLKPGESYLISVLHRRYLFALGSVSFIVENDPIRIDFQAEETR